MRQVQQLRGGLRDAAAHGRQELRDGLGAAAAALLRQQRLRPEAALGVPREAPRTLRGPAQAASACQQSVVIAPPPHLGAWAQGPGPTQSLVNAIVSSRMHSMPYLAAQNREPKLR